MKLAMPLAVVLTLVTWAPATFAATTVYTSEADFLNDLAGLGRSSFAEGFEDDSAWGDVRSTIADGNHTAPSITASGITWTSNNSISQVTTGPGPARTGDWGFYTLPHGDFENGIGDGFQLSSAGSMYAVGGWIKTNTPFAKVHYIVDDSQTIDFDDLTIGTQFQFLGVIDTTGFNTLQVREVEGVLEDQKFIFADDFTIAVPEPDSLLLAFVGAAMSIVVYYVARVIQRRQHPVECVCHLAPRY